MLRNFAPLKVGKAEKWDFCTPRGLPRFPSLAWYRVSLIYTVASRACNRGGGCCFQQQMKWYTIGLVNNGGISLIDKSINLQFATFKSYIKNYFEFSLAF
jgi:hypothetical protein